jgi:hypothetical protein
LKIVLSCTAFAAVAVLLPAARAHAATTANSHWLDCNSQAVRETPRIVWDRIQNATYTHRDIPGSFWTNATYRGDIARIICYESTFNYHAENAGHYGWFQMGMPQIAGAGVTFDSYWYGTARENPGWYQCTAGERYIRSRYGTPLAAWEHEANYGWY